MREGPDHYTRLKPEPIDVIRAWELPWCTANALKYIARYRNKGGIEDLKKARHYLDMEIEALRHQTKPDYCPCDDPIGGSRCTPDSPCPYAKDMDWWRWIRPRTA